MSFKAYLVSKGFWISTLLAIVITVMLLIITMFVLKVYTNHGESFAVPDLTEMNIEDVKKVLDERDLLYQITDSLYLRDVDAGSVVDQVPAAGFEVKRGRTVFLTICATAPEQVAMPKLTDISYRQALNLMMSMGLNVGNVDYVPSEFPNLVLEQQQDGEIIAEGTLVNKGSNIDLTVGQNRFGEKTDIPNLLGVSLEQANQLLAASYLNVGAIIYDDTFETIDDSLAARIWQQRPEPKPGAEIEQGTSIDIWLTVDDDKIEKVNELEL